MAKELPPGYRLGEFSIERLLSRNGLQAHYAAQQVGSSRACRLTIFNVDPEGDPWKRFRSDLGQLHALSHPIIAENLGSGSTPEGQAWAAWAQPEGEDLATRLRRGGALTLREALSMARQIAAALHAGHRIDVLHRALTPDNIYFVRPGDGAPAADYEPTLLYGFGVARLLEGALDGVALVGQTEYMAPEQFTGLSFDIGPATDQYALALIVYQVLSASQPFHADSAAAALLKVVRSSPEHLRALRPDLPSHVDAAVTRGLAKDRLARFPDLAAFITALSGDAQVPAGLQAVTGPWLGGSVSTDEALSRAAAAGSSRPSVGAIAQGMGDAGGVPEVVEDQATTPNTMEDVMRLALPPEKSSPANQVPPRENSAPIELEPLEPTPPPITASGRNAATPKLRGNNLPSRSGETKVPDSEAGPEPDSVDTVIVRNIYPSGRKPTVEPAAQSPDLKGTKAPSVPAPALLPPAPPTGLAAMLPASLAPHAPRIENVLYLVVGLFLGFLIRALLK